METMPESTTPKARPEPSEMEKQTQALAQNLIKGTITQEEKGVATKMLQTLLASTLVNGISNIQGLSGILSGVTGQIALEFQERLIEEMEAGMSAETAWDFLEKMLNKQIQILDLQRKVVQGKELFPEANMNDEDKASWSILYL